MFVFFILFLIFIGESNSLSPKNLLRHLPKIEKEEDSLCVTFFSKRDKRLRRYYLSKGKVNMGYFGINDSDLFRINVFENFRGEGLGHQLFWKGVCLLLCRHKVCSLVDKTDVYNKDKGIGKAIYSNSIVRDLLGVAEGEGESRKISYVLKEDRRFYEGKLEEYGFLVKKEESHSKVKKIKLAIWFIEKILENWSFIGDSSEDWERRLGFSGTDEIDEGGERLFEMSFFKKDNPKGFTDKEIYLLLEKVIELRERGWAINEFNAINFTKEGVYIREEYIIMESDDDEVLQDLALFLSGQGDKLNFPEIRFFLDELKRLFKEGKNSFEILSILRDIFKERAGVNVFHQNSDSENIQEYTVEGYLSLRGVSGKVSEALRSLSMSA